MEYAEARFLAAVMAEDWDQANEILSQFSTLEATVFIDQLFKAANIVGARLWREAYSGL